MYAHSSFVPNVIISYYGIKDPPYIYYDVILVAFIQYFLYLLVKLFFLFFFRFIIGAYTCIIVTILYLVYTRAVIIIILMGVYSISYFAAFWVIILATPPSPLLLSVLALFFCTLIEMIPMSDVECSFGCHKGTCRTFGLLLALTLCSPAADIGVSRFFQSFMGFCKSIVSVTCCFLVRNVRPT